MTAGIKGRLIDIPALTPEQKRDIFEEAGRIIRSGSLVAFPTETVYGLGANALDADAVKKIYEAKGRPSDNPLILHVCDIKMAEEAVCLNRCARLLMEEFWPGPLSLVLEAKFVVPPVTRGGLPTAAVRMPDNNIAIELIRAAGVPIAAPSANKSGRPSPTDALTVMEDIGAGVDIILDGGPTRVGLESTVLDITGENPVLLRPGGISKEQIESVLGLPVMLTADEKIIKRSPGTRYRHYAPKIPLILADEVTEEMLSGKRWAWIGLSNPNGAPHSKIIFSGLDEYAKEFFRALRTLEKSGAEVIVAEIPDKSGIGAALMDRLKRASGI